MIDFDKIVIEESYIQPVIVEFSYPGCGPCLWMEKILVEIIREIQDDVHFVSLPITDSDQYSQMFNIRSNPTTIIFSNGKPKARLTGALPKIVVLQWVQDHIIQSS